MTAPVGRLRIGPACGQLTIRTRREGLAAKAGNDITIDSLKVRDEVQVEFDVDLDVAGRVEQ